MTTTTTTTTTTTATTIPAGQLMAARNMAAAYGHLWAQAFMPHWEYGPDGAVDAPAADIPVEISVEEIRALAARCTQDGSVGGIDAPTVVGAADAWRVIWPGYDERWARIGSGQYVVHTTGSGRLSWAVDSAGDVILRVGRPGDAWQGYIVVAVVGGEIASVEAHHPLHWRHWAAMEEALRAAGVDDSELEVARDCVADMGFGDNVVRDDNVEWASWLDDEGRPHSRVTRLVANPATVGDGSGWQDDIPREIFRSLQPMGWPRDEWELRVGEKCGREKALVWRATEPPRECGCASVDWTRSGERLDFFCRK